MQLDEHLGTVGIDFIAAAINQTKSIATTLN